jgi:RluA family pseudouridine synthase
LAVDRWQIPKTLDGTRADRALRTLWPAVDRETALKALKKKSLLVNGTPASLHTLVHTGDVLVAQGVKPKPPVAKKKSAEQPEGKKSQPSAPPVPDTPLLKEHGVELLFLDAHLCVVNKPAGMPTHPADGVGDLATLTDVVRRQLEALHIETERPPSAAGRLDRGTSGVVILTVSRAADQGMARAFESDAVDKTYLALARGVTAETFSVDTPLSVARYVRGEPKKEKTKDAVTDFERLVAGAKVTLLRVRPKTGRLHQIRRHLREVGHPIVGDGRYGWREDRGSVVFCLHCQRVAFAHPVTQQPMVWTVPLPRAFAEELEKYGVAFKG